MPIACTVVAPLVTGLAGGVVFLAPDAAVPTECPDVPDAGVPIECDAGVEDVDGFRDGADPPVCAVATTGRNNANRAARSLWVIVVPSRIVRGRCKRTRERVGQVRD